MPPDFESLGSIPRALAGVGLLFAAAYGLGRIVAPSSSHRRHALDCFLLQIAVGLTLVGFLGAALGTARLLGNSRSIWLLMGLASLSIPAARRYFSPSPPRPLSPSPARRWLYIPALLLALVTLGPALCYPTGWDEMVYHHELPRRWLAAGWPAFYTDIPYSGFPSLGEILFWLIAPIEDVITPRLVVWVCWMLGLILVYRLLRRRLAIYSAATLSTAFALSGAVLMISANCYVESILLMIVAALLLVLESRRVQMSPWRKAAIVGVLVGGAAAVKLTGLAIFLLPCLWYSAEAYFRRGKERSTASSLAICLLIACVVSFPFYLRPWLLTGNPFYPYYAHWFSADPASLEMSRYHHALGAAFGVRTPSSFATGPILLASNAPLFDGTFGWQLLLVIFLAVLAIAGVARKRFGPVVLKYAPISAWLYIFWFFTAQQARFAIPAVLALMPLAALGLRRFRGPRRKLALASILALTAISLPWRTSGHYLGSWMTAIGAIRRSDYVNTSTDGVYLPLVTAIHEHTPPDARLLVLFEHRGLYLPRRFEIGTPFFQEAGFTPPESFSDPERLMQYLRDRHFTHVVITNAPAGPDQVPSWFDRLEGFLPTIGLCARQGSLRIIWQSERYILLKVEP